MKPDDYYMTSTGPIARFGNQWFSVNGTRDNVIDKRYKVEPPYKGYIQCVPGTGNQEVFYHDGHNVYRAQVSNAVDVTTGYLIGRWECTIEHWNRYAEAYNRNLIMLD